jgi:hypothetical protein
MFVLTFASFAQAQKVKTITGNLCGHYSGEFVGTVSLRIGTKVVDFTHMFRVAPGFEKEMGTPTKYIKADPDSDKIGSEYIVRYQIFQNDNTAISIKFTGKVKKIKPCSNN